jgi:hypothetical protein
MESEPRKKWPNIGPPDLEPYTDVVELIPPEEGYICEWGRLENENVLHLDMWMTILDVRLRVIAIEYNWGFPYRYDRKFRHVTVVREGYAIRAGVDIEKWSLYTPEDAPMDRVCGYCGRQYAYILNESRCCPYCNGPWRGEIYG